MSEESTKTPPAASSKAKADLIGEIGTLTYPRAVRAFGKERAVDVMKQVAEIGGHGLFDEKEFMSPLFGGLAMPDPNLVIKPRPEEFEGFGDEADFYYQQALEQFEKNKGRAANDRVLINDLYNSLK